MDIRIVPRRLQGIVTPPGSKSMSHRLLLAAALAEGVSTVKGVSLSEDVSATLRCISALGAQWDAEGDCIRVRGGGSASGLPPLDCGESGSTLRFLMPVALALAGGGVFTGQGRVDKTLRGIRYFARHLVLDGCPVH